MRTNLLQMNPIDSTQTTIPNQSPTEYSNLRCPDSGLPFKILIGMSPGYHLRVKF